MILLAKVRDGEIINLLTVSRVKQLPDGSLRVVFVDGAKDVYVGEAARFLDIELAFALSEYRTFQKAYSDAVQQQQSHIVRPDGVM